MGKVSPGAGDIGRHTASDFSGTWEAHSAEWREPADAATAWSDAGRIDPILLKMSVRGRFWETLEALQLTLLVTREYEHLLIALTVRDGRPFISFMRLPHPSGIALDRTGSVVFVAATRNPNQIYEFAPVRNLMSRYHASPGELDSPVLMPVRTRLYPGALYIHDLAWIGNSLYANSVGQNAVVCLGEDGSSPAVWWPACIDSTDGPRLDTNYLQLNSIAAGTDLTSSYFSASARYPSRRRPGHQNFPVDGRGVIFSGATREPVAFGLTRPHSARLHRGRVWVDNSGYGQVGFVDGERLHAVFHLPGWTRGLAFAGDLAFAGTSRVIPRFRQYAPGLDVEKSTCGLHILDTTAGTVLGSLSWPAGNQIFAIETVPAALTSGLPFGLGRFSARRSQTLFSRFLYRPGNMPV